MIHQKKRNIGLLLPVLLSASIVDSSQAKDNPFSLKTLTAANQSVSKLTEMKCGEGRCGSGDTKGMVMGENNSNLPKDCPVISKDYNFTIHTGSEYALTGKTFGYESSSLEVKPCSRITVTLINDDAVRHQWMLHGLPRYLYPGGMFHLEAQGGQTMSGTFIVPSADQTYLVHCDIPQHMEKGMKAEVIVGAGSGHLPSIPGISGDRFPDEYSKPDNYFFKLFTLIAGLIGFAIPLYLIRKINSSEN